MVVGRRGGGVVVAVGRRSSIILRGRPQNPTTVPANPAQLVRMRLFHQDSFGAAHEVGCQPRVAVGLGAGRKGGVGPCREYQAGGPDLDNIGSGGRFGKFSRAADMAEARPMGKSLARAAILGQLLQVAASFEFGSVLPMQTKLLSRAGAHGRGRTRAMSSTFFTVQDPAARDWLLRQNLQLPGSGYERTLDVPKRKELT